MYIYILELKDNKYYVGKTKNPDFRLKDHYTGKGSTWTNKYLPLKVVELLKGDDYDELKYTIKYMQKYGINNVRGANFCRLELTNNEQNIIKNMIDGISDKCYKCGKYGHFANECFIIKETNKLGLFSSIINTISQFFSPNINYDSICCRCYRTGHIAKQCYAKTYENGSMIKESQNACYKCGRDGHYIKDCYATTDINGDFI